jgi:hypothetical protein
MFNTATNQTTGFMPDEDKYNVECLRIEEAPDNGFGVGVRWVLGLYQNGERILQGDGNPLEFWQTTSPNMGPKARARQYVEAFLGRALEEGERINPNDLPGKWLSGMVIHEDSTTKQGQKVAKLVSVKPYTSGTSSAAPKTAPHNGNGANVEALRAKLNKLIDRAEKDQTESHLTWLALNVEAMNADELQSFIQDVTNDLLG